MCGYPNIRTRLDGADPRRSPAAVRGLAIGRPALLGLGLWLALALGLAAPALADPAPPDASAPRAGAPERAVSTSPDARPVVALRGPSTAGVSTADGLPLTRAADRQRIESISPIDWLSRYGAVEIGRVE